MNFEIHLEDGEKILISLHRLEQGGFLCMAAKTAGKGKYIQNPPSGWEIRRDPKDDAFSGQPEHYHCKRTTDGLEIVITADGGPSHKTESGTSIPKKLGDHLKGELGLNVKTDTDGKHVVRLVCVDPWDYYFPPFHPDLIARLWHMPAQKIGESDHDA